MTPTERATRLIAALKARDYVNGPKFAPFPHMEEEDLGNDFDRLCGEFSDAYDDYIMDYDPRAGERSVLGLIECFEPLNASTLGFFRSLAETKKRSDLIKAINEYAMLHGICYWGDLTHPICVHDSDRAYWDYLASIGRLIVTHLDTPETASAKLDCLVRHGSRFNCEDIPKCMFPTREDVILMVLPFMSTYNIRRLVPGRRYEELRNLFEIAKYRMSPEGRRYIDSSA